MQLPNKKYRLIYADPPWQYDNVTTGRNNASGAASKYKTIPLDELCDELPDTCQTLIVGDNND